jgi:hypothetical protein
MNFWLFVDRHWDSVENLGFGALTLGVLAALMWFFAPDLKGVRR